MSLKYRYTLVICCMDGSYLTTRHFTNKSAMLACLSDYIALMHQVEVMAYSVWLAMQTES